MLRGSGRYAPATPPLLATRPGKSRGLWKVRVAAERCYYALDGVSVVGWRSLHALPSTSAYYRRQAASRHERLAAFASRSKTRQRSFGRRSGLTPPPPQWSSSSQAVSPSVRALIAPEVLDSEP